MDYTLSIRYLRFSSDPYVRRSIMVKAYVNVKLPEELAKEVDEIVKARALGYRSRGEFVAEATRALLMKVRSPRKE